MASGREIIPVGEAATALYNDTSMNGSNGPASPIVVEPGDREGPIEEMPERAFYMYAPQFHWTLTMRAEDRPARSAIESIAHEQYRFGTQAEECHRRLIMGQVEAERRIIELEARVARLQDELAVQQLQIQAQRQHYEESLGKMEASYRLLQQRVTQDIWRHPGLSMQGRSPNRRNPCVIHCRKGLWTLSLHSSRLYGQS